MSASPEKVHAFYRKQQQEKTDKLPGGLADDKSPEQFDQKALAKGVKVESEHTFDKALAREIAMDHLAEDPKYYDKLEKIEEAFVEAFISNKNRVLYLLRNPYL